MMPNSPNSAFSSEPGPDVGNGLDPFAGGAITAPSGTGAGVHPVSHGPDPTNFRYDGYLAANRHGTHRPHPGHMTFGPSVVPVTVTAAAR